MNEEGQPTELAHRQTTFELADQHVTIALAAIAGAVAPRAMPFVSRRRLQRPVACAAAAKAAVDSANSRRLMAKHPVIVTGLIVVGAIIVAGTLCMNGVSIKPGTETDSGTIYEMEGEEDDHNLMHRRRRLSRWMDDGRTLVFRLLKRQMGLRCV